MTTEMKTNLVTFPLGVRTELYALATPKPTQGIHNRKAGFSLPINWYNGTKPGPSNCSFTSTARPGDGINALRPSSELREHCCARNGHSGHIFRSKDVVKAPRSTQDRSAHKLVGPTGQFRAHHEPARCLAAAAAGGCHVRRP